MEAMMIYIQPFFGWLVQTTLIASLVICLILLIQRTLGGKLGPRWSHALWLVLLIRMVLPWAPSSRFSLFNLIPSWDRQAQSGQQSVTVEQQKPSETAQTSGAAEAIPAQEPEPDVTVQEPTIAKPITLAEQQSVSQHYMASLRHVLPALWLAGAIVIGAYLLVSDLALWRIVKRDRPLVNQSMLELFEECKAQMGVQSLVVVVPSEQVRSPGLFGFVRPRLLLPRQMLDTATRQEMRYVFLHELAHLKRHDIYLGWLASLLQVLHWFNPLVWFGFYRMRADRELACDALVLTRTGQDKSQEYGGTILGLVRRFSQPRRLPAMAGVIESKSQLKRRIAMITQFKNNSYRFSPLAAILFIILACISLPDAEHTKASEAAASQPANQLKFTKIQIPNRIPWDAQLSPDGKSIAFVNEKRIWIMPRSSRLGPGYPGAPKLLDTAGVEADWCGLTWSADGKWIAFNGKEMGKEYQRIYVVSATGGGPKQVHENNRGLRVVNYRMSLSPHGETLAFASIDAGALHIYTLPIDGGSPTRLVDTQAREPVFSPDGKMIAYVEDKDRGRGGGGLWVVPAGGGASKRVADAENASTPVWSPDGTMLAFVDGAAPKQIQIVPVTPDGGPGGETITIGCPADCDEVRRLTGWTPDGQLGAMFGARMEFALYAQPVRGGKATFITHGGYPMQPHWSPDGERIIHVNNTDEASGDWQRYAIAYVSAEGGEVTTVPLRSETKIRLWAYGTGNHISPDGKTIVFAGQKPEEGPHRMHIWTLPVEGGTPRLLTDAPAPFRDWYPSWSPDGRNVAFVRMEGAKALRASIYVVPAEGGEPKQIASETDKVFSSGPVLWSPDGKLLAYFSRDTDDAPDGAIRIIPAEGGESRIVTKVQRIFANKEMAWSPDSKRIAYNAPDNEIKNRINIVSLDDGTIKEITPDLKAMGIYHLDWSPDGETLVFGGTGGGGPEFWVMENFLPATTVAKSEPMTTVRKIQGDWGTFASLSPDGKFMCDVDWDTENLAVLELATGKVRHLTGKGPDDACYPLDSAISPDNREVAYLWWDPDTRASSLHVVGLDGSGHRLLHEGGYPMPRAWSANAKNILAVVEAKDGRKMVWVSASDGSMQEIASIGYKDMGYPGKFDISPDGRFIAYDRPQAEGASERDLFLWDLNEKREISLVRHPANDKLLGWTPDGNHVFFASDRTGSWDAWLLRVSEGKPQGFPQLVRPGIGGAGELRPIGFTPGGSYYYAQEQILEDVFVAKLNLNTGEVLSEPVPVHQTGATACHDWSPDGRYLAYSTRRPDELQTVYIRTLATGQERILADNLPYIRWLRWSFDGRSILIDGFKRGNSHGALYKLDTGTGERTDLVHSETKVLIRPEMSRDGKTLFFDRVDLKSKSMCLMARDLETGREKELIRIDPPARLTGSALSPDGQQLVLSIAPSRMGADGPALKIMPATGGEAKELIRFEGSEKLAAVGVTWMPDSRNVLFWKLFLGDKSTELWRISAEGGAPRRLWVPKDRNMACGHFRVHPDGQRIAFTGHSTTRGVWAMENFLPTPAVAEAGK